MKLVPLTQGLSAQVSDQDYDRVMQFKWCVSRESRNTKWYAIRWVTVSGKQIKIRMHRYIMGLPVGTEDSRVVDHLDHDGLNNQRENLEITDQETNMSRSMGWRKKVAEPCL